MGIGSNTIYCILILMVVSVVVATEHKYKPEPANRNNKMNDMQMYREPEILFTVEFEEEQLTYIPSDMGPETAVWPGPICYVPEDGLYVVDPGKDQISWKLDKYSTAGKKITTVNLINALNVKNQNEFIPCVLESSLERDVALLASLRFDFQHERQYEYRVIRFNKDCEVLPVKMLSKSFSFDKSTYFLHDGSLFNLQKKNDGWNWLHYHDNEDSGEIVIEAHGKPTSFFYGNLLQMISTKEWISIDSSNVQSTWSFTGMPLSGTEPVIGYGMFTGFIAWCSNGEETGDTTQRFLDVLYVDENKKRVVCISKLTLLPQMMGENVELLKLFDYRHACFDRYGNVYEVARNTDRLIVYYYQLVKDVFDRRLHALYGRE